MSGSILEVVSSHSDVGLARLRFVLRGSVDSDETARIEGQGLRFSEGEVIVTTSLEEVASSARVVVVSVPNDVRVGCAVFTTAYIDRKQKRVTGAPMRYAAARSELAFYTQVSGELEDARKRVESELGTGNTWAQQKQFAVPPQYLVGSFGASGPIQDFLHQLDRFLTTLQPLDISGLSQMLQPTFYTYQPAQAVLAPVAIRDIIIGTAEAKIMSRLRMMRWQGLATLGYQFFEGREVAQVESLVDVDQQYRRIDEFGRALASSQMFGAELEWLKAYATNELVVMKVELDGG